MHRKPYVASNDKLQLNAKNVEFDSHVELSKVYHLSKLKTAMGLDEKDPVLELCASTITSMPN
jgi:hypothetical protein